MRLPPFSVYYIYFTYLTISPLDWGLVSFESIEINSSSIFSNFSHRVFLRFCHHLKINVQNADIIIYLKGVISYFSVFTAYFSLLISIGNLYAFFSFSFSGNWGLKQFHFLCHFNKVARMDVVMIDSTSSSSRAVSLLYLLSQQKILPLQS